MAFGVVAQGPAFDSQYRVFRGVNDDEVKRTGANATTQLRLAFTIRIMERCTSSSGEIDHCHVVQYSATEVFQQTRRSFPKAPEVRPQMLTLKSSATA